MRPRHFANAGLGLGADESNSPLTEITGFGPNPGALRLFAYRPENLPANAPLVVILHGCGQTARGYAWGAGWSELADRFQFALIAPEQTQANNLNTCFNWFLPDDTRRDSGEAASMKNMIAWATEAFSSDPKQIYISGLSAGGAMANVMLTLYPEIFAGGSIVAGLPYGAASNVQQAIMAMHNPVARSGREWGDLARSASSFSGPWPRISIWHGEADHTVVPANMEAIAAQWADLHHADHQTQERKAKVTRRVWLTRDNKPVVEAYSIAGLGHGTPINPGSAKQCSGHPAPFILDAGISSSLRALQFFGIVQSAEPLPLAKTKPLPQQPKRVRTAQQAPHHAEQPRGLKGRLQQVIEKALASAGLLK